MYNLAEIKIFINKALADKFAHILAKCFLSSIITNNSNINLMHRTIFVEPPNMANIGYNNQNSYIRDRLIEFVNYHKLKFCKSTIENASMILFNEGFLELTNNWIFPNYFKLNLNKVIIFQNSNNKSFSNTIKQNITETEAYYLKREFSFLNNQKNKKYVTIQEAKQDTDKKLTKYFQYAQFITSHIIHVQNLLQDKKAISWVDFVTNFNKSNNNSLKLEKK